MSLRYYWKVCANAYHKCEQCEIESSPPAEKVSTTTEEQIPILPVTPLLPPVITIPAISLVAVTEGDNKNSAVVESPANNCEVVDAISKTLLCYMDDCETDANDCCDMCSKRVCVDHLNGGNVCAFCYRKFELADKSKYPVSVTEYNKLGDYEGYCPQDSSDSTTVTQVSLFDSKSSEIFLLCWNSEQNYVLESLRGAQFQKLQDEKKIWSKGSTTSTENNDSKVPPQSFTLPASPKDKDPETIVADDNGLASVYIYFPLDQISKEKSICQDMKNLYKRNMNITEYVVPMLNGTELIIMAYHHVDPTNTMLGTRRGTGRADFIEKNREVKLLKRYEQMAAVVINLKAS